ncbi:hypothetical protein GCM10023185_41190 [Hymenobacter saemangeumensis]|uniref:Ferritin-like domain-containing protein n=1 Tax=Hymenobacter saemangeumensis TaxID=1084522 RepID=A0ABP8IRB9_9BACT
MSDNLQSGGPDNQLEQPLLVPIKRRSFFMYAGATAGATALVLAGCKKDDDNTPVNNTPAVDLGSGDVGVLNYAYALEQLEAAFYAEVVSRPYTGMTADEQAIMRAIARHEAIHRDFFKAAIPATNRIANLTPNFTSVDFSNRQRVLETARTFEDLGVAAYNGAGPLLTDVSLLGIAGKIVSVEARHAAQIRELITPGSFASDVVNARGLDQALTPAQVLTAAQPFIRENLNGSRVGA